MSMQGFRKYSMMAATSLALVGLCCAIASGFGVRFGLWDFRTGFAVLKWSVIAQGVAVVLALAGFALARFAGDVRHALVLVTALVVFAVPYAHKKQFERYPTVADATTNIENPPSFNALIPVREKTASNPLQYRGEDAAAPQRQYFPDLAGGLQTDRPPAEVIEAAGTVVESMGWTIAAAAPDAGRLEATDTTFWFGFKDDVVVRARRIENGQTRVDVRSASRVGYRDGGTNARRIRGLLETLKSRLEGRKGG